MIENLKDQLYQLENKLAKRVKLGVNIRSELEVEKFSKTYFKVLERQNMQNQTKSEFTDHNKSEYSKKNL